MTSRTLWGVMVPPARLAGEIDGRSSAQWVLADVLARDRRSHGDDIVWMPGTDPSGLAVQMAVEKHLYEKGSFIRHDLGRDAFERSVWDWHKEHEPRLIQQFQFLDLSCDWSRHRHVLDTDAQRTVSNALIHCFDHGWLRRERRMVHWCTRCLTALDMDEVVHVQRSARAWPIRYALDDKSGSIEVPTARPETLMADEAILLHPRHPEAARLRGRRVVHPLSHRRIPVLVDERAPKDIMRVTPAHGFEDYELALRHNLPLNNIMDPDGALNEEAMPYEGMSREECREVTLQDLMEESALGTAQPMPIRYPLCRRCRSVLEPRLSNEWFLHLEDAIPPLTRAIRDGDIGISMFVRPGALQKVTSNDILARVEGLRRPWCISRQSWWGLRLPASHCSLCKRVDIAPDRCPDCGGPMQADDDVVDSGLLRALWPLMAAEGERPWVDVPALAVAPERGHMLVRQLALCTLLTGQPLKGRARLWREPRSGVPGTPLMAPGVARAEFLMAGHGRRLVQRLDSLLEMLRGRFATRPADASAELSLLDRWMLLQLVAVRRTSQEAIEALVPEVLLHQVSRFIRRTWERIYAHVTRGGTGGAAASGVHLQCAHTVLDLLEAIAPRWVEEARHTLPPRLDWPDPPPDAPLNRVGNDAMRLVRRLRRHGEWDELTVFWQGSEPQLLRELAPDLTSLLGAQAGQVLSLEEDGPGQLCSVTEGTVWAYVPRRMAAEDEADALNRRLQTNQPGQAVWSRRLERLHQPGGRLRS